VSRFARVSLLVVLLASALVATPRAVHAVGADGVPLIIENTAPISISASDGTIAPNPSTIAVPAQPGVVLGVAVRLNHLSHTFASDLDIMLVAPGGVWAMLLSDVGGDDTVSFGFNDVTLTLSDNAGVALPGDAVAISSGTYRPTNYGTPDRFPGPVEVDLPASLAVFDGLNPEGSWSLWVADDFAGADGGVIAGGWSLALTISAPFANTDGITINDAAKASPYPSTIEVAGVSGRITNVTVTLDGLSHGFPRDLDILLVAPSGTTVMLMSDPGDATPVTNTDIVFDDDQPAMPYLSPLPSNATLSYRPTNNDGDDPDLFAAPAPAGPYGTTLASLLGQNPEGTWGLFIVDDLPYGAGTLAGWRLDIATDAVAPVVTVTTSPLPNAAGWNKTNVTVTSHAEDNFGGSGLSGPSVSSVTYSQEGAAFPSFTAADRAFNQFGVGFRLDIDKTKPTMTRGPVHKFVTNTRLETAAIPVTIFNWLGTDPDPGPGAEQDPSGLASYWTQQSLNGAAFTTITPPSPLATATSRQLTPGKTYRFQTRAVDVAGNTSNPSIGSQFAVSAFDELNGAIAYSAGWVRRGQAYAYGGAVKYATAANSTATFTFTGTNVAWVSTRDTNRGQALVSIDGGTPVVVDLYASTLQGRRIVFSANGLTNGPHTITIQVLSTKNPASTGTRVDIDLIATLS
jgi:subtilisin-like proprotein convertase family protein